MAKRSYGSNFTPQVDSSYGLIYRLNDLWVGADRKALAGDLEGWNHVLNVLYRNLLYRNPMEVEYINDDKEEIKTIKVGEEDSKIYKKFKNMIRDCRKQMRIAVRQKDRLLFEQSKEKYAETLAMKDIWLRKFMQERGLYLKEVEFDPSRAMWGG